MTTSTQDSPTRRPALSMIQPRSEQSYVLITAAYNEEQFIEDTIQSVIAQDLLPAVWIIVSDGSTDRTDEIVRRYATSYSFIHSIRRERDQNREFASKVFALNVAVSSLPQVKVEFVGVLDADVSLDPNYFYELLKRFADDPGLGLAGGWYYEGGRGEYRPCWGSSSRSIPGGIQMFRQDCYRAIGGLLPIEYGGEDWYAEIMARKCGWRVRSFPDLHVRHLRVTGTRGSKLRYCYREGIMDFALGSHPLFEVAKIVKRIMYRPYALGALARLLGFLVAHVWVERMIPPDVVNFLRKEELARLWSFPSTLVRGKRRCPELELL
jgi:poly-beta-1,6-N-acetyl-D-glucosamine synthase